MKEICIFSESLDENEMGGISASKYLKCIYPNESFKRLDDLFVPFGIQLLTPAVHREPMRDIEMEEYTFMEEKDYSKLFDSIAKPVPKKKAHTIKKRETKKKSD
jgi:hypothetical protein